MSHVAAAGAAAGAGVGANRPHPSSSTSHPRGPGSASSGLHLVEAARNAPDRARPAPGPPSSSLSEALDLKNAGATKRQGMPMAPRDGKAQKLAKDGTPRRKPAKKAPRRSSGAGGRGNDGAPRGSIAAPGSAAEAAAAAATAAAAASAAAAVRRPEDRYHPRWVAADAPRAGHAPTFADPRFGRDFSQGGGAEYPGSRPPPGSSSFPYNRIGADGAIGMVELGGGSLPPPLSMMDRVGAGAGEHQNSSAASTAADYGGGASSAASGRTWRSGSVASDDDGGSMSASIVGDSEDCGSVAGSVAGSSVAGDVDGDIGGAGGAGAGGRGRGRSRGGRSRGGGRGSGRGSRGGKGGRGSRPGSGSRRRGSEGGGKGKANEGFALVGKTIKLHRDDVDYPNGRWCVADVRQWSPSQQKYLLSYRGLGSAWLQPGWIKLEDKRKVTVVTVAAPTVGCFFRGVACARARGREGVPQPCVVRVLVRRSPRVHAFSVLFSLESGRVFCCRRARA